MANGFPFISSLTLLLTLTLSTSSRAGIIVSIENASLTAGGPVQFVNVSVSSTLADQHILVMATQFNITPITPVPGGSVRFVSDAFDPNLDPGMNGDHQYNAPYLQNYLFYDSGTNTSLSQNINVGQPAGLVAAGGLVYVGGDGFDDPTSTFPPYVELSGTSKLIYRFALIGSGAPVGIEQFSLDIDPATSSFFDGDNFITPTSTPGTISLSGTAAVPEPSTSFALILATGCFAWRATRRQLS